MRWRRFLHRDEWDAERALEVEAYLELETADNVARGMTAAAARSAAQRKLGNRTLIREEIYQMNTIPWFETAWRDLRFALRLLRKNPTFTIAAVASLALGIGANTAIFSVVHAVLLRALPYPQPNQLVHVGVLDRGAAVTMQEYQFWKDHGTAYSSVAGVRSVTSETLIDGEKRQPVDVMTMTADFFRTLGTPLALGRDFSSAETSPNGPQAIILSDRLWRQSFGADPTAIGRVVVLSDHAYTVVGVVAGGFWFPRAADAFVPLRPSNTLSDTGANTEMLARLRPGVSLQQARAEMAAGPERFRRLSALGYQEWVVGDVRTKLVLLFGASALLLVIACSNLASLILARLAARQKEMAVRMALGGGRSRLLRQFLTENLLLSLMGGAGGLLGAYWLLKGMVAVVPFPMPSASPIRLDLPVLGFTFAISLVAGVIFSLTPFLSSASLDVNETLKASGRSSGSGGVRQRTRNALVVSEVALSVTLLVAAALTIQSLYQMHREQIGFSPQGVITFWAPPTPERRRSGVALRNFEAAMIDRLHAIPGVRKVAAVNVLPLDGWNNIPTEREGHPEQTIGGMEIRLVTPEYFEALQMPVLRGRGITPGDTGNSAPVILVNETLAKLWWPQGSPLGDHVVPCRFKGNDVCKDAVREVVGVVGDTKTIELTAPPMPTVYLPAAQALWYTGGMHWVVRGELPARFAARLRTAVSEMDPHQRVDNVRALDDVVARTMSDSRFDAWLFGGFAVVALMLTAIGIYGLLSFMVARRTAEFGTRMALGASRGDVLRLVLKQGLTLTGAGLVLGLGGAWALGRFLKSLLFGVGATDPMTFVAVSVVLLCIGLIASYVPAVRATRTDPMVALRQE